MPDSTLPGFNWIVRDGGLVVVTPPQVTQRILIIGNALDGPVNTPFSVQTLADAEAVFGPMIYKNGYINPNTGLQDGFAADNNLMKGLYEVFLGGGGNIILCRVGGNTAISSGAFGGAFDVLGRFPGRIYNGVTLSVATGASNTTITITQPATKGNTLTYQFVNSFFLGDIANQINNDRLNASIQINVPLTNVYSSAGSLTAGTVTLSGGTNGTGAPGEDNFANRIPYYNALTNTSTGTFLAFQDVDFDIATLNGIYGDDCITPTTTGVAANITSVADDYANFLFLTSKNTRPCHGVLRLRPIHITDPLKLANFVSANYTSTTAGWVNQNARWLSFGYFMNRGFKVPDPDTGEEVDQGRFLSIIGGPDLLLAQKDLGLYVESGGNVYAGLMSAIPWKDAPTHEPLGSVTTLAGRYNRDTQTLLNQGVGKSLLTNNQGGGAYVTFQNFDDLGQPGVVSDNTACFRGSDYQRVQIYRIVTLATHLVKGALQPFIGKGMDPSTRMAMKTQTSSALSQLSESGALIGPEGIGFRFAITATPAQQIAGEVTVQLQLIPSIELRRINVTVNVTAQ